MTCFSKLFVRQPYKLRSNSTPYWCKKNCSFTKCLASRKNKVQLKYNDQSQWAMIIKRPTILCNLELLLPLINNLSPSNTFILTSILRSCISGCLSSDIALDVSAAASFFFRVKFLLILQKDCLKWRYLPRYSRSCTTCRRCTSGY